MVNPFEIQCGPLLLQVIAGSIAELEKPWDALVSSDDNYLSHGGGVSAALWRAAGEAVQAEALKVAGRLRLGQVTVTTAGRLAARHLIHAVTIDLDQIQRIGSADARDLVSEILETACRLGCGSLALPLLGTGAGQLGVEEFSSAAADALEEWLDDGLPIRELAVVTRVDGDQERVFEILRRRFGNWREFPSLLDRAQEILPEDPGLAFVRQRLAGVGSVSVLNLIQAVEGVLCSIAGLVGDSATDSKTGRTEGEEPKGLRQLLDALRRAEAGGGLPRTLLASLASCADVRDRIAHGIRGGEADRQGRGVLWKGLRKALEWIAACAPGRALSRKPPLPSRGTGKGREKARCRSGISQKKTSFGRRETVDAGIDPVRRLHEFLRDTMGAEELAELQARLETEGYKGSPEMRLLEYCVRIDNPVRLLTEWYSPRRLRLEVEKRTGLLFPAGESLPVLARALLDQWGFPSPGKLMGLPHFLRALEEAHSKVHVSDMVALKGLVSDSAARIERALLILIHFVVKAAFETPAEVFLWERGWLDKGLNLERCTLGSLLDLVERLDTVLRQESVSEVFRVDFQTERLFPKGCSNLAALRNSFSHYKADAPSVSESEARAKAQAFFQEGIRFFQMLKERKPPIFPMVIAVQEIRVDRWGRRTVEAVSDEGRQEFLFTDLDLQPGQAYFMHPLTNPFRVFPILQPAGHLGSDWEADRKQAISR